MAVYPALSYICNTKIPEVYLISFFFVFLIFITSSLIVFNAFAQQGGADTGGSATSGSNVSGPANCYGPCYFYGGSANGG